MKECPLISIIVPIYKVEKYLGRCIESLINQTYRNIEIILVDDGSPDNCPLICDNYAKQDKRITVIHKENGGLSDARNCGLRLAKGEYVLFVDSDDYIKLDSCDRFAETVKSMSVDIAVADADRIEGDRIFPMTQKNIKTDFIYTGKEFLKLQIRNDCYYVAVWTNLYRRRFLIENSLFFKPGILYEDEQWTPRVFLKAQSVIYLDYVFYYYEIRPSSITSNTSREHNIRIARDMIGICYELFDIYDKLDDYVLKRYLKDTLCYKYLDIFQVANLKRKGQRELIIKGFVFKTPYFLKTRLKAYLFCINTRVYYYTNKIYKIICGFFKKIIDGRGKYD